MACSCPMAGRITLCITTHRHPSITEAYCPPQRMRRCAANEDGRSLRAREEEKTLAVGFDFIRCKAAMQELERLIRECAAACLGSTDSAELRLHPASTDTEQQASAGEFLNRRHPLRRRQRRAVEASTKTPRCPSTPCASLRGRDRQALPAGRDSAHRTLRHRPAGWQRDRRPRGRRCRPLLRSGRIPTRSRATIAGPCCGDRDRASSPSGSSMPVEQAYVARTCRTWKPPATHRGAGHRNDAGRRPYRLQLGCRAPPDTPVPADRRPRRCDLLTAECGHPRRRPSPPRACAAEERLRGCRLRPSGTRRCRRDRSDLRPSPRRANRSAWSNPATACLNPALTASRPSLRFPNGGSARVS